MDVQKEISDLKKQIRELKQNRVFQQDVVPDAIKMRHMGEANRFVRAGTAANKPTTGEAGTDSLAMYYDITNNKLWVYNGSWRGVTLS